MASEAMTAAVITVTPTTRFDEAAHIMLSKKVFQPRFECSPPCPPRRAALVDHPPPGDYFQQVAIE